MKSYYRIMLGKKSIYAGNCVSENFIGVDFGIRQNLSHKLPDNWRDFNREFVPVYQSIYPDKTRVAAGLACGFLWRVSKGIVINDIVLCPDGIGNYYVGEVIGDYYYEEEGVLPHRRPVRWLAQTISRDAMSESLRNSSGSIGTVSNISKYSSEIEGLLSGSSLPTLISSDETIEDAAAFAMEKHLEHFLVTNWDYTELGRDYDIYHDEGELVGQQYDTDTGAIDILAISKDQKTLLVIEPKKGRASDAAVGQILRYMGYVQEILAEDDQAVKGIIIALDDNNRLQRALAMVPNVEFYRYQVSFRLFKA